MDEWGAKHVQNHYQPRGDRVALMEATLLRLEIYPTLFFRRCIFHLHTPATWTRERAATYPLADLRSHDPSTKLHQPLVAPSLSGAADSNARVLSLAPSETKSFKFLCLVFRWNDRGGDNWIFIFNNDFRLFVTFERRKLIEVFYWSEKEEK